MNQDHSGTGDNIARDKHQETTHTVSNNRFGGGYSEGDYQGDVNNITHKTNIEGDLKGISAVKIENSPITQDLSQHNTIIINGEQKIPIDSDYLPNISYFQGRVTQIADLNVWLTDSRVSVIGIVGEGGIGKSTLMGQIFANSPDFKGKFWGNVEKGTVVTELMRNILLEFGISQEIVRNIEEKNLINRLLRLLQQGRYLIAIDNLESVIRDDGEWQGGYDEFWRKFQECGSESVLLLASREYPPNYHACLGGRWLSLDKGLTATEGGALLRARGVEDDLEICSLESERLGGNPLALCLIAGWLVVSYREGNRFLKHLDLFEVRTQVPGYHRDELQTLDQVLQWSLDRISETQRALLAMISVLRGSFSLELAHALLPEIEVTETMLNDLARRNLLQYIHPNLFQFQPRFREFVEKRTSDSRIAHERAIAYFWEHRLKSWDLETDLTEFAEYEETFYHQCQLGRYGDAYITVLACDDFLRLRGYYQTLIELYGQLYQYWQPQPEERGDYAAVCNNLGLVYSSLGQYGEAKSYHEQSLAIQREIGYRAGKATSLGNLMLVYYSLGQYGEAKSYYEQSLAIQREIGDRKGEATSLMNLGNVYYSLGQYGEAKQHYEQSLVIQREIGYKAGEASSLMNLGSIYSSLGQYGEAKGYYEQSLAIQREIGDRKGEATSLMNLGNVYYSLGQYGEAKQHYEQSLVIQREIGYKAGEASSLMNLGSIYSSLGQYGEAKGYYEQSLAIQREIGDRKGEATSLMNLGLVYSSLGQYGEAKQHYEQSLVIQREIGYKAGEASSLMNLGSIYSSLGQYGEAKGYCEQSLAIQREIGDRQGEASSLINLGNVYDSLGQYGEAKSYYEQSLVIQRELGDRQGEALSLWNLGNLYQQIGKIKKALQYKVSAVKIWQSLRLPVDATPLPEFNKRMLRQLGEDWADSFLQSVEQMAWLMYIIAGVSFLISIPIRLFKAIKRHL